MKNFLLILLCVSAPLRLAGTQPTPNGLDLTVLNTPPAFSNWNFYYWQQTPDAAAFDVIAFTTNRTFHVTNVPPDSIYAVTALAQSNQIWRTHDIGIAGWRPDIRTTNKMLRVTPTGGVLVSTGEWVNVSLDGKTFSQMLKFHNPAPGVIRVEHKVSTNTPELFIAYPAPPPTPPLPGLTK